MDKWKKVLNQIKSTAKNQIKTTTSKVRKKLEDSDNKYYHTYRALKEAKENGGIKKISKNKYGTHYTYKNGTGYWVE